jgi:serine/threonine protein kinase
VPPNEPIPENGHGRQPATVRGGPHPEADAGTVAQGAVEQAHARRLSEAEVNLGAADPTVPASPAEVRRSLLMSRGRPQVPGYEVLNVLGSGTYGVVWRAREEGTGIQVAIKFFAHGTGQQWQLLQEEVKQLAELDSVRGIVHLKDVCPDATPPYYVMAYAENGSLAERLGKGPLPLPEALPLFRQVVEALAYVHAKGIRHCDLKPGNILLDALGRALIADFGQAHFSSDASPAFGTFFYMAPEQADLSRQIPDTRWDVYGLGALFHAMLTRHPPRYSGALRQHLEGAAELPERLRRYREAIARAPRPEEHRRVRGMDRDLAELIDRCLEIDPQKRPHDAGAVLAALDRRQRRRRQRPLLLFGLAAPLLLLAVMAAAGFWAGEQALNNSRDSQTQQLLESDEVSARLVANVVQEQLESRAKLLRGYADYPLSQATVDRDEGKLDELLHYLIRAAERTNNRLTEATVTDQQGNCLAVVKIGSEGQIVRSDPYRSMVVHYSWRDWFNGIGDQTPDRAVHYPPITAMHVSDPYISTVDGNLFVSISLPIPDPDEPFYRYGTPSVRFAAIFGIAPAGPLQTLPALCMRPEQWRPTLPPVGVLEAAIKIDDISQWLDDVNMQNGYAVLVDQRRYCLRHQDQQSILAAIQRAPGQQPRKLGFDRVAEQVAQAPAGRIGDYIDPVDHRSYLAGYARTSDPEIGWIALVQHDREAALQPIANLRSRLIHYGVMLLVVAGLLTSALWGWLFWTLRRTENIAYG